MEKPKAYLTNKLWIPIRIVDKEQLIANFEIEQFDDKTCEKCDYFQERPCELCYECPAYEGKIQMWSKKNGFVGVPFGDRVAVKRILKERPKIIDKRVSPKVKYPLKITSKLREHQIEPIKQMLKTQYGILQAPARSGKTFMAICISIKMGLKTLILAAQQDWLDQFMTDFRDHTNLLDVEKWEGRKIVGIATNPAEMIKLDVALATYQSFISDTGIKKLKQISSKFGLVITDEVQGVPAKEYSKVIGVFKSHARIGLTATPDRKDRIFGVATKLIGPVKAKAIVETLIPRVTLHMTPATTSYHYRQWTSAMKFLYTHKGRNLMIIKQIVSDIKAGRHIVVPCGTVAHVRMLVKNVNKRLGEELAVEFTSKSMNKTTRKKILDRARSGKIKCVVGTRQLVQVGINIPIWDTLYCIAPISNVPKFTQETARIRTVVPGKPQPIIRFFVEEFGPSIGCMRTCLFQTFMKDKFVMDGPTKAKFLALANSGRKKVDANFGIV